MQEFLSDCSTFNINVNSGSVAGEKSRNEERLIGKSKGWLNWLSLGVLGAGGTDDSGQFSGVVSDEIIKVNFYYLLLRWRLLTKVIILNTKN